MEDFQAVEAALFSGKKWLFNSCKVQNLKIREMSASKFLFLIGVLIVSDRVPRAENCSIFLFINTLSQNSLLLKNIDWFFLELNSIIWLFLLEETLLAVITK